ncbi:MAG: hypothetical protein AAGJ80_05935 [Cyanobacteria bacterium J06553_1]
MEEGARLLSLRAYEEDEEQAIETSSAEHGEEELIAAGLLSIAVKEIEDRA